MRVPYNKLVRDRIPEIIKAEGHQPVTRILDQEGYQAALLAKLLEEAQEASAAPAVDLPAELADVLEVLQALVRALGMIWEDFLSLAARKRAERGGFDDRIFLEHVESGGWQ
jgi:predicted house-cleaning noncanonical NTP pyrophosphatase (MazG superfamily)